jgi:hypothetical protein
MFAKSVGLNSSTIVVFKSVVSMDNIDRSRVSESGRLIARYDCHPPLTRSRVTTSLYLRCLAYLPTDIMFRPPPSLHQRNDFRTPPPPQPTLPSNSAPNELVYVLGCGLHTSFVSFIHLSSADSLNMAYSSAPAGVHPDET